MMGAPFLILQSEQTRFHRQFGIDLISIGSSILQSINFASGIQYTQDTCAHLFSLVVGFNAPPTFGHNTQRGFFLLVSNS